MPVDLTMPSLGLSIEANHTVYMLRIPAWYSLGVGASS